MKLGIWRQMGQLALGMAFAVVFSFPAGARSVTGNASDVGNCFGTGDTSLCTPCEGSINAAAFCNDYTFVVQDTLDSISALDQNARASGWEQSGGNPYTSVMGANTGINGVFTDLALNDGDSGAPDLFDAYFDPSNGAGLSGQLTFLQEQDGAFILTLTGQTNGDIWTGAFFFGRSSHFSVGETIALGMPYTFEFPTQVSIYTLAPESNPNPDPNSIPEPSTAALVMLGIAASMMRRRC